MADEIGTGTEENSGNEGGATPPAPRTFSEDEVNRIVKERLARQKTQFGDYDELKAKASKFDEIEEANRSELEKAQQAAANAVAERDKILAEARETRIFASLLAEAAKADRKVVNPEAAVRLLDRSTLELGEDGVPTNTAQAVDALLESMPFLVVSGGSGTRGSADQGARQASTPGQLAREDLKGMSPEDIVKARREGKLANVVSGTK